MYWLRGLVRGICGICGNCGISSISGICGIRVDMLIWLCLDGLTNLNIKHWILTLIKKYSINKKVM